MEDLEELGNLLARPTGPNPTVSTGTFGEALGAALGLHELGRHGAHAASRVGLGVPCRLPVADTEEYSSTGRQIGKYHYYYYYY